MAFGTIWQACIAGPEIILAAGQEVLVRVMAHVPLYSFLMLTSRSGGIGYLAELPLEAFTGDRDPEPEEVSLPEGRGTGPVRARFAARTESRDLTVGVWTLENGALEVGIGRKRREVFRTRWT